MRLETEQLNPDNAGLAWGFHVSPDSCDNPDYYNNYIRFCAFSDYQSGVGVTHLLIDKESGNNVLAGYVTLRATSLVSSGADGVKNVQPALEIAELAVHEDYERNGVGLGLIAIAVDMADSLRRKSIGIKYILVCSDPKSIGFYEKSGFVKLSSLYEALHDGWNNHCEPLFITLPEIADY